MLSRLLFLEPKSEHRNEAVHSALLPTGLRVRVDPRESGRQALLVRTCPQANTRESTSRRQRDRGATGCRAALCGRARTTGLAVRTRLDDGPPDDRESETARVSCVGDGVSCGRIHCENRCRIAADPPAGDASSQTRNTSNDKSVKVSTSYFKIEVNWR